MTNQIDDMLRVLDITVTQNLPVRLINVHVLKEDLEYVFNEESLKRNDRLLQTSTTSC